MSSSVLTITRRDIRDSLQDWRTFLPLTVLAVFLPLILRVGIRIMVGFLDDADLTSAVVPLGLLIAGFLPASFSLIGPLESFVGERERNTLESLLSAPVSDRGLYLGKLAASLTPPLMSSAIAMTIYTLATYAGRPVRSFSQVFVLADFLTPAWIAVIVLMIAIKTVMMVTAAVYLSSRTTSIRAANLLASFILIPMTFVVQVEALLLINKVPFWIIPINLALLALAIFFVIWGLRSFNREELLGREHKMVRDRAGTMPRISSRNEGAVLTVARREIRDTLTDWRILIPIMLLSVLVPLGVLAGTIIAYNKGLNVGVVRLMPFFVLLVGFLPASFSLIVALEMFVGEKERGTLESLFAMPMSDGQLYRGKILAAFVPPLLAGVGAILVYVVGLFLFAPTAMLEPLRFWIIVGMIALSSSQALAMVAGAVVISSHTSSVRVANLLASFILVPITVITQIEAVYILGERWDILRMFGWMMLAVAAVLVRAGMGSFNRESILSREHLGLNLGAILGHFGAFFSEIRHAGADPEKLPPLFVVRENGTERRSISAWLKRFYRQELPIVWREIRLPFVAVTFFVLVAIGFGMMFEPQTSREIDFMRVLVPTANIGNIPPAPPFWAIFLRNARSIFFSGIGSIFTFGFFSVIVPVIAFFSVSYGATWAHHHAIHGGAWGFVLGYALPHGIIELPAAMLGAALALRMAGSLTALPAGYGVGRHVLWAWATFVKVYCLLIVPMLLIASIIESTLTPLVLQRIYG